MGIKTISRTGKIILSLCLVPVILLLSGNISNSNAGLYLLPNSSTTFSDVPYGHWAWVYIQGIYDANLTTGYPDGTYRPENPATRAEMAVFLLNGMGISPPTPDGSHPFSDISGHWAEAYIEELFDQEITGGFPDGTFRPEGLVTRAEMAVFLLNTLGISIPAMDGSHPFSDIDGHWAESFIEELYDQGLSTGYPDGTYQPDNQLTRAEIAVFLVNAYNLPTPPAPTPTPTPTAIALPDTYCPHTYALPDEEQQILEMIHDARDAHGREFLGGTDKLVDIARMHGSDMTCAGKYSHNSTDGTRAWERIGIAMYFGNPNWCYSNCCCGEIFYGGSSSLTPEQAFDWWMNHEPDDPNEEWNIHKRTILGEYYNRVGVGVTYYEDNGVIRKFYTVDFCRK